MCQEKAFSHHSCIGTRNRSERRRTLIRHRQKSLPSQSRLFMCVSNFARSSLSSLAPSVKAAGFLPPRLLPLYLPTSKSNFAILVASSPSPPPIVDGGPLYSLAPHGGGGCLVSPPPLLPHVERSQATERNKRGFPFALISLSLSPPPPSFAAGFITPSTFRLPPLLPPPI